MKQERVKAANRAGVKADSQPVAGGKKRGGQRRAVPYWVPLAAERIFMEYSGPGEGNGLSVSDVVRHLKDIYDCEVSDDYVREKLLPAMMEFGTIKPRLTEEDSLIDFFSWDMRVGDPADDDDEEASLSEANMKREPGKKGLYWFRSGRLLRDHEIELLIAMIDASPFMKDKDANDLVRKLRSLQFQGNRRMRAFLLDTDFDSGDGRAVESGIGPSACKSKKEEKDIRPSTDVFLAELSKLYDSIVRKKTISFTKLTYSTKVDMAGVQLCSDDRKARPATNGRDERPKNEQIDVTPYALRYADGHCFLLTNNPSESKGVDSAAAGAAGADARAAADTVEKGKSTKGAKGENKDKGKGKGKGESERKDRFSIHRVDLVADLKASERESSTYVELNDPQSPFEYLRWSMNGMGGKRELIKMRCNKRALHYLIERFSNCEGWSVTPAKAGSGEDGRPKREKDWYTVTFAAPPKGIGYWVQKFLDGVDVIEPERLRKKIAERVNLHPYHLDGSNGSRDAFAEQQAGQAFHEKEAASERASYDEEAAREKKAPADSHAR